VEQKRFSKTFNEYACVLSANRAIVLLLAKANDKDTETKGNQMTISPILTSPSITGKALYLELVNNPDAPEGSIGMWHKDAVKQVIIMPQHLDEVGIAQPVQIWDRTVSKHSPRSQWDANKFGSGRLVKKLDEAKVEAESGYHISYESYSSDELASMSPVDKHNATIYTITERLKSYLLDTYTVKDASGEATTSATQTWVVRDSKPLAIEMTNEEFELAMVGKTPQAVIRRIQKARVSAGFPEKIV
jgi:hypothetical protein